MLLTRSSSFHYKRSSTNELSVNMFTAEFAISIHSDAQPASLAKDAKGKVYTFFLASLAYEADNSL